MIPLRTGSGLVPLSDVAGPVSPGVGAVKGKPIRALLEGAGLARWQEKEVSPALRLKVRRGFDVSVRNVGTDEDPVWEVRPAPGSGRGRGNAVPGSGSGVRRSAGSPESGAIPLLIPLGTGLVRSALRRGRKAAREEEAAAENPWEDRTGVSGFEVGALDLVDTDGYAETL